MRKLSTAASVVLLACALGAQANLLIDGGFETNYTANWGSWSTNNIIQPTGWGWQYEGNRMVGMWWSAGLFQDFDAVPGSSYVVTAHAFLPQDDPAKNGVYGSVVLEWYNSLNQQIGSWSQQISAETHTSNIWLTISSGAQLAPANTDYGRVLCRIDNGGSGSGRIYYDAVSAEGVIPEPLSAALLGVAGSALFALRRRASR